MQNSSLVRLDVDLGADVSLPESGSAGSSVAISPDGTRLVFASGSPSKLFARRLDQVRPTEIPGTQGALTTFFSPDGQWVGFYSSGKVNKISIEGGAFVPLGATTKAESINKDSNLMGREIYLLRNGE